MQEENLIEQAFLLSAPRVHRDLCAVRDWMLSSTVKSVVLITLNKNAFYLITFLNLHLNVIFIVYMDKAGCHKDRHQTCPM